MPQIFHPSTNTISRVSIAAAVLALTAFALVGGSLQRSPYLTEVGVPREQPIPFSHKHHVAGLGIDCRYCHTSVEESSFAGIPPTETCMNCHREIWKDSPMLEAVRESYRSVRPGVGCASCHGRVDDMPLTWRVATLHMDWCLDCHRHPERWVRPREHVFDMAWQPPADQEDKGRELVKEYEIMNPTQLTSCDTCHR